jgi:uncharacterized protein (DUF2147 family)
MKKNYFFAFLCCFLMSSIASAQITILDFESAPKSTTFQYFGSSLEPQLTGIINNPDKTGINTSAKVGEFKKPAASMTWAGAFSSPNPATQVDLTAGGMICIKVWADHTGNLALKLEGGSNGAPNWVQKVEIKEVNKWVEICFDPSLNSLEGPNKPGIGASYKTVVLFFDFDIVLPAEKTWYFDDLVVKTGSTGPKKATFNVNMKNYVGTFGKVYVSGTFNNWSGDANELTDPDGDKTYSAQLSIPQGGHEYKFTIDNWKAQEEFNGLGLCTVTDPSGKFHNRSLTLVADKVLDAVCFNSCYKCGDGVNVTMNLAVTAPSADGVYLVGGGNFDAPGGKHRMQDPDKDGIYSIKVERQKGFNSFYSFANGNCPDYSCKENIAGQACANPANFNDRKLNPVTKDTIINTCFGFCSATTACGSAPKAGKIKFRVDMKNVKDAYTKVYVSGTFNNWSGDANELTDPDKDKIFEGTIAAVPAGKHEFKFQMDAWAKSETFKTGDPCTVTDPSGQFVNRKLEVNGDSTLTAFCYSTCSKCPGVSTKDLYSENLIKVQPTVADDLIQVMFSEEFEANSKQINLISLDGKKVQSYQVAANTAQQTVSVKDLANGLYILQALSNGHYQTVKIVVNH